MHGRGQAHDGRDGTHRSHEHESDHIRNTFPWRLVVHVPRQCLPTQCGLESVATNGHQRQKQVLPCVREADQIREDGTEQHSASAARLRDLRRLADRLVFPSVLIRCQPPSLHGMRVERLRIPLQLPNLQLPRRPSTSELPDGLRNLPA